MKISEYIAALQSVQAEIGDVEVQTNGHNGRVTAASPKVAHEMVLKGRESRPRFWSGYDSEDRKGDPVCKI